MKKVGLGKRLNGIIRSILQVADPNMSANDGLDQALVPRALRPAISFQKG
jgi:hypothetical protein